MKELFYRINIKKMLKYLLYMTLSLLAQNTVFTQIRPLGVCPMVLPAVAVAVGMFEGATWGAVFSLIMGLFADMAYVENTVCFTLLFPALAFASGFISQFFINRRFFAFMGVAVAAMLITAAVQSLLTFASDTWSMELVKTALLQTLWSIPAAALVYFPPARWMD